MNSRERVQRLKARTLTGSYCISIDGIPTDGMSVYAYCKLLKMYGMDEKKIKLYDLFQYLPIIDAQVTDRIGGDFIHAERPRFRFNMHHRDWKPGKLDDGTLVYFPAEFESRMDAKGNELVDMDGMEYAKRPKGGLYFDIIAKPLEGIEDISDLKLFHPATRMSDEDVDETVKYIEKLYETTDKGIVLLVGGQHIEQGQRDFGYEDFYCNLLIQPKLMHTYFRMITDSYLDAMERILGKCGDKVDVVWFTDDIGTQDVLQMSIPTFREMIKPYKKELCDLIHDKFKNVSVLYHSCGAIFDLIPDFIDMGADMLNPVQISAKGMDPKKLVETYGKDIIFWGGGIDTQTMRPEDTVEDVVHRAENLLDIFSAYGNYVFTQVHNFQADTEPEKIEAIFKMAREKREAKEKAEGYY